MKRLFILPLFLTFTAPTIYCQGIYFKASSHYNIPISKQEMPEFFTYQIQGYTETMSYNINLNVNEFSVASGTNFQGAAGYSFNEFLSFELKFSIFNNSKREIEASPVLTYAANGKTEWNLNNYSIIPTLLVGQTFNKSTINIFVYSGLGSGKLNIKASLNQEFREYEFERSRTFSWGYGLEYSHSISKNFSIFTSIGVNNTGYKPEKAQLVSSSTSLEHFTISQKEIKYVDEITNLELGYNGLIVTGSPEIRLKETLKLNSLYLGVGIKYTLKK